MAIEKQTQPPELAAVAASTASYDLDVELQEMRSLYSAQVYPPLADRKALLKACKNILISNESKFVAALNKDYGYRSEFDSVVLDLLPSVSYINYLLKNIGRWLKKDNRRSGLLLFPSKIEVHHQPLGVVGVVVPWNFPIYLALGPAASAIAAGNKVMIKMSEYTPNINAALIEAFAPLKDQIRFYDGGVEFAAKFVSLAFDHLLFTGSTNVGRIVAKAAAENLTPVTLELGGKSPTIVTKSANLNSAIDNIVMGKVFNSGQICVSPDYLFVHEDIKDQFVHKFIEKVRRLYAGDHSNRLTKIISKQHVERLNSYLADAEAKGAQVIKTLDIGDDSATLYPTLVSGVTEDMLIMREEVFGSLLSIMPYSSLGQVCQFITRRPKPLALYIMTGDSKEAEHIIKHTHSGGVCINDTVIQVGADDAPFGGIGDSGMGQYHGKEGFLTFSKSKTVVRSKSYIPKNWIFMRYRDELLGILKKIFLR